MISTTPSDDSIECPFFEIWIESKYAISHYKKRVSTVWHLNCPFNLSFILFDGTTICHLFGKKQLKEGKLLTFSALKQKHGKVIKLEKKQQKTTPK